MNLSVLDLGLIEYEQAWKLQEKYAVEIAEGKRTQPCCSWNIRTFIRLDEKVTQRIFCGMKSNSKKKELLFIGWIAAAM